MSLASDDPLKGLMITFIGDADNPRWPDAQFVVLAWTAERPDDVDVWGPFRTKTRARDFGRERFPRRYKVAGMHHPGQRDFYWSSRQGKR